MMFCAHDGDDGVQVLALHAGTMGAPLLVIVDNLLFGSRERRAPGQRTTDHAAASRPDGRSRASHARGDGDEAVRCIRRAQASGAYRLAGFYDAGVLAYEVAVQNLHRR